MNLNTVTEVKRPAAAEEITQWREGYAWLAGGTWLFSTPQIGNRHADRPRDRCTGPRSAASAGGLDIAATCTIAELDRFDGAGRLDGRAPVSALLPVAADVVQDLERGHGRRQHLHVACPPAPMISLTTALEAIYTLWPREAQPRDVAAHRFRHRQSSERARARASCCATSISPPARLPSASPSAAPRSPISAGRRRS